MKTGLVERLVGSVRFLETWPNAVATTMRLLPKSEQQWVAANLVGLDFAGFHLVGKPNVGDSSRGSSPNAGVAPSVKRQNYADSYRALFLLELLERSVVRCDSGDLAS